MSGRTVEFALWRWVALVVLFGAAYFLGRSWRYAPMPGDRCVAGEQAAGCLVFDRWNGDIFLKRLDTVAR